jgi:hypothetical protein
MLFKVITAGLCLGFRYQTVQTNGYQQEIWYIYELKTPGKLWEKERRGTEKRERERGRGGFTETSCRSGWRR